MKKKLVFGLSAIIMVMTVCAFWSAGSSSSSVDCLLQANVDALAYSESDDGTRLMSYCLDYGGFYCCAKNPGWCGGYIPCEDYM